jgi:hypothetical protein
MLSITALYAGILGIMSIGIAFGAGSLRGKTGISIGHGDNAELHLAMRRHGNFAEFVPLALVLIGILELNGVTSSAVHGLGAVLVVARICHAMGIEADSITNPLRGIGAGATALVTVVASVWAIWSFAS